MGSPGWGIRYLSGSAGTAENKRALGPITGLGHGLINWCDDVRFTPESGHSGGSRKTSANDP